VSGPAVSSAGGQPVTAAAVSGAVRDASAGGRAPRAAGTLAGALYPLVWRPVPGGGWEVLSTPATTGARFWKPVPGPPPAGAIVTAPRSP
jgi:hypothetical protein